MGKTLNLGVVAHADAGKTTLTEQILFRSGAIRRAGSVDEGTAVTDGMEIERSRGISVRTACASVQWKDCRINLIDAPGHADFLSEVERTLAVLDAAVLVISSVEGVQPQTRLLLEAIRRANLPCFLFFNKLDRAGSNWRKAFAQVEKECGTPCLSLTRAEREEEREAASVPLDFSSSDWEEAAVLASGDEVLLERLLSGEACDSRLWECLKDRVSRGELYPAVCGASKFGLGVPELLDGICRLLKEAEPLGEELCARVYKVEHDPALGKAAYVRLFAGEIRNRQTVDVVGKGGTGPEEAPAEKVTRVRAVEGRRFIDGECLAAGEIGVIYGMESVQAGDLLGKALSGLREYRLAEPLLLSRVEPELPEELPQLTAALRQLEDEDPALGCEWNREKQELWARLTGKLQIEVLEALLLQRWEIRARFGEPSVIYRETPASPAEGFESYTWPKPCWAEVRFLVEPLPRGAGFQYECLVSPGKLPYRYQTHVETAVPRALKQGIQGWQVTDLKVTLVDGGWHHIHTHPLDFFVATPMGLMNALRNAGSKLLEPVLKVELSGPQDYLGKAMGVLASRRAVFQPAELSGDSFRLEALVPAAEAMELPVDFAAATGGMGIYSSRFSHYQDCPEGLGASRGRVGPDPLDRAKFILAARSAMAGELP
ncbi:GTP-binding protein [Acutalibacter sp. 1XD8-33]|uniref:elongation factor G n=1 Tax=Acutalibacter sp. 1XD8-33 TaxID=2320081 RepID=UPI000EA3D4BF|nr:TetM/TetW/TetO/TetS family tetracycline resistance ribosomal protection protein [Acutalibacter sp. 1XD8-33]RKJ38771.1 GTP-binding protein [Acutalibacter sp. 1XD8-33]